MSKLCFYIDSNCDQRYIWLAGVPVPYSSKVILDDGRLALITRVILTNVKDNRPTDSVGRLSLLVY